MTVESGGLRQEFRGVVVQDVADDVDAGGFFADGMVDGGLAEDGGVAVFDVEHGGTVEGVGSCYVEIVAFALQQLYGGNADVVGASRGTGGKDTFRFSGADASG